MRSKASVIAAFAALASQGCGLGILTSYPTHVPFLRAASEHEVSTRDLEPPAVTSRVSIDTSPLRVVCEGESVRPRVEVTTHVSFDVLGRVWCGFMAVSETAFTIALATVSAQPTTKSPEAPVVAAIGLGGDALATLLYTILAPSESHTRTHVSEHVVERSSACPDGIVLRSGATALSVGPDGKLSGDVRLVALDVVQGAAIDVVSGSESLHWTPTADDVCAIAKEFSITDAIGCGRRSEPTATPRASSRPHFDVKFRLTPR